MTLRNYQDYPLNLLAGVEQELAVSGSYWQIVTASSPVQLVFDESRRVSRPAGSGGPASYSRVRVRSAVDQAVVISLGFIDGAPPYDRGNTVFSGTINLFTAVPSINQSLADVLVPAGTRVQVSTTNAARRALLVTNLETNAGTVRVGDSTVSATSGLPIQIGTTASIDGTPSLYVFNPNATDITVALLDQRS